MCRIVLFPSHPFAYFLIPGYLLRTPDNLNFFRFPYKVRAIESQLYHKYLSEGSAANSPG